MPTKLNKAMREEIVASVLQATTYAAEKAAVEEHTEVLAREILEARIPAGFLIMAEGQPREWFQYCASTYIYKDEAPMCAFAAFDGGDAYAGRYISFEPLMHPSCFSNDLTDAEKNRFVPLRAQAEEIVERFAKLRQELRSFLASCTTVEKALERMPELGPHIPQTARSFPLVANTSNLLSDLLKCGFKVQKE